MVGDQFPNYVPSPKAVAIGNLFSVSMAVYSPRLLLLRMNAQNARRAKAAGGAKTMDGTAEPIM